MKNLFAAVVLAVIVFFLSSCGEGENASSAVSVNMSTEAPESVASVEQLQNEESDPEILQETIFEKEIYANELFIDSNTMNMASAWQAAQDICKQASEGDKAAIIIKDFKLKFIAVKNEGAEESLLTGFDVIEVYCNDELHAAGNIEVFITETKDKILVKNDDRYIAYFSETSFCILDSGEEIDELYCDYSNIRYAKKTDDNVELGNLSAAPNSGFKLEKQMEFMLTEDKAIYSSEETNSDHIETDEFSLSGYPSSIDDYLKKRELEDNENYKNFEIERHIEEKLFRIVYYYGEDIASRVYYNGTLLCEPNKLINDVGSACIRLWTENDVTLINYSNIWEDDYTDRIYWIVINGEPIRQNGLNNIELQEDGTLIYYRLADGKETDYLYNQNIYGPKNYSNINELKEKLEDVYGKDAPDLDSPYYEYGTIVVKNGKSVFNVENTVSIRDYYNIAKIVSGHESCC